MNTVLSIVYSSLRFINRFQVLNFLLSNFELACQKLNAVMKFLIVAVKNPNKRALLASEYNRRALILMLKKFFIRKDIRTPLVSVAASENQFTKKVSCHSINPIELTFVSAVWTSVRILHKPICFAVST